MDNEIVKLNSGTIKIIRYNKDDLKDHELVIKGIIHDIYTNTDFDKEIVFILSAKPKDNYTKKYVINEYVDSFKTKAMIISLATSISDFIIAEDIKSGYEKVKEIRDMLFDINFCNVIFNRFLDDNKYNQSITYAETNYFIYSNDTGKEFMDNNTGSTKMINRVVSKS